MIIRRQVLEKIGPLDEGYYTYFDDIDYCFNAGKAGWPTWYVPRSRVVHLEGASTGIGARDERARRRLPPYWFQARRRFFVKNYGPLYAALADAAYIVGLAMFRLRRRIQRKPDPDPPQLLWDSIRNSIFFTGPRLRDVENPALARPAGPPVPPAVATGAGS